MNSVAVILGIIFIPQSYTTHQWTEKKINQRFHVEFEWTFLNFTWPNEKVYNDAIITQKYIPGNSGPATIKFYKNKFYVAIPRICDGVPVTMGYVSADENTPKVNPLISPFPDWQTNNLKPPSCDKLLNVQSMEIDKDGIMWVIDGLRTNANVQCPPKLILYDLNHYSAVILNFNFPEEISLSQGGFLNDIVVDDRDGAFAYITDHSAIDPGLIVYSRAKNRAWKLRDASMFPENFASNFVVDEYQFNQLEGIDGIALSPAGLPGSRKLFFTSLVGVHLFSISTDFLKNEQVVMEGSWRANITRIGAKQAQSDGMIIDSTGVLYYGLLPLYGVGSWNINTPFSAKNIVDHNRKTMIWADSLSFDDRGYLYLLANQLHKYFLSRCNFYKKENIRFRLLKYYTGTQSYLF